MSMAMRTGVVSGLAQHMRGLPEQQARILALDLTCEVSAAVARLPGSMSQCQTTLPCFPRETWNELTVGVPWEAFSFAHGAMKDSPTASGAKALCSAPAQLDAMLASQAVGSGLWGGSLLVALGTILEGVRHHLAIFSPYWRVDGVRSLLSAAGRKSYQDVQVQVFTQPATWMTVSYTHLTLPTILRV